MMHTGAAVHQPDGAGGARPGLTFSRTCLFESSKLCSTKGMDRGSATHSVVMRAHPPNALRFGPHEGHAAPCAYPPGLSCDPVWRPAAIEPGASMAVPAWATVCRSASFLPSVVLRRDQSARRRQGLAGQLKTTAWAQPEGPTAPNRLDTAGARIWPARPTPLVMLVGRAEALKKLEDQVNPSSGYTSFPRMSSPMRQGHRFHARLQARRPVKKWYKPYLCTELLVSRRPCRHQ